MNKNAKLWVKALESGKYKQCRGALNKIKTNGFCCLGVACDLYHKKVTKLKIEEDGNEREFNGEIGILPEVVRDWLGLRHKNGMYFEDTLTDKNDNGASFKQIAKIIKSEPLGLFE